MLGRRCGAEQVVYKIDIACDDEHGDYLGSTEVDIDPVHEAFYAYAGPWASARLIDGPKEVANISRVMYYLRGSTTDWPIFQKAMGRTDVTDRQAVEAYAVWIFGGDPPAGEVSPEPQLASEWHRELSEEWSEIEDLARKMLDGMTEIAVGDGVLVQINQTCWQMLDWNFEATS